MTRHIIGPVSIALFALSIAAPAFAGGPLEAPDNTSGNDVTGWTPIAFIFGGIDTASSTVRVTCMNTSPIETDVAVQYYDAGDSPTRQPDNEDILSLPSSDIDLATSAGAGDGTMTVRILVEQKKAAKGVACTGVQLDSGIPVAGLETVYIKKGPKIKISK